MVRTLASHQCGPGSNPGDGMWVEFVVGSLPCCERFFSGYSGFPLSPKTNISKFQLDQESGRQRTTSWMCYLQIIIHCLYDDFVKFFVCLFFFCFRCVIRQLPTMPHHGKIDCLSEERRDGRPKFHHPLQLLNQKWRNIKPKHDMEAGV